MSDDYKIYIDAGQPATFNNGAGAQTDCATLRPSRLSADRSIGHMRLSGSTTNRNQRECRFPAPWSIEEHEESFIVKEQDRKALRSGDRDGRSLRLVHFIELSRFSTKR